MSISSYVDPEVAQQTVVECLVAEGVHFEGAPASRSGHLGSSGAGVPSRRRVFFSSTFWRQSHARSQCTRRPPSACAN